MLKKTTDTQQNVDSPFQQRLQTSKHAIKSLKLEADMKRTASEKLADYLTATFGTVNFLLLNIVWFVIWIIVNLNIIPGIQSFDPYPFGLLTMIVSLEAIILAIVVLISENRAAKIADLRDEIDFHVDLVAEDKITKLLEIMAITANKNGIDLSKDEVLQEMIRPLNTNKLEKTLEKQI